jgi:anti-sigma B factor antagonist
MYFDCTSERVDDVVVVTPSGEIDRDTAPAFRTALEAAVTQAGRGPVEVELGRVTFMDSSGVGALLAAHRLAESAGASFRVRNPTKPVRTVLDITNVSGLLGV